MGIHVNAIGHRDAYPVSASALNLNDYFTTKLNDPCDPAYVENGVIDDYLDFPWFKADSTSKEVKAYTDFITALCNFAKKQTRVTATEKQVDNEKYAFRCFLLRLGLIGEEYKQTRKILLQNLEGSSAFKNGGRK